jgi:hypothetical protein
MSKNLAPEKSWRRKKFGDGKNLATEKNLAAKKVGDEIADASAEVALHEPGLIAVGAPVEQQFINKFGTIYINNIETIYTNNIGIIYA